MRWIILLISAVFFLSSCTQEISPNTQSDCTGNCQSSLGEPTPAPTPGSFVRKVQFANGPYQGQTPLTETVRGKYKINMPLGQNPFLYGLEEKQWELSYGKLNLSIVDQQWSLRIEMNKDLPSESAGNVRFDQKVPPGWTDAEVIGHEKTVLYEDTEVELHVFWSQERKIGVLISYPQKNKTPYSFSINDANRESEVYGNYYVLSQNDKMKAGNYMYLNLKQLE